MSRRSAEIPLLPPPGVQSETDRVFLGDEQVLKTAMEQAAVSLLQRRGQPLNRDNLTLAGQIVADATKLALTEEEKPPMVTNPRLAQKVIRRGLALRTAEQERGKALVKALEFPSGPGSPRPLEYDLALPHRLVTKAREELRDYQLNPRPAALRQLIKRTTERQTVLPQLAVAVIENTLELTGEGFRPPATVEFEGQLVAAPPGSLTSTDTDPFALKRFVPDVRKQSIVARGGVAAAAIRRENPAASPDPLYFREEDIAALVAALPMAGLENQAAALAQSLPIRPESLTPAAATALVDFGQQIKLAVTNWNRSPWSTRSGRPGFVDRFTETFGGLPLVPLVQAMLWTITPETLEIAVAENRPHLWEKALILQVDKKYFALPSTQTLSQAALTFGRTPGETAPPARERLRTAIKAMTRHEREKKDHPERIKRLQAEIQQLEAPPPKVTIFDQPLRAETAVLMQSGQVASLSGREQTYARALQVQKNLRNERTEIIDPQAYAAARLELTEAETRSTEASLNRLQPRLRRPVWTDFPNYKQDRETHGYDADEDLLIPLSPERLKAELAEVSVLIQEMMDDPNLSLPAAFSRDRGKLKNFLGMRMANQSLKPDTSQKMLSRIESAIKIVDSDAEITTGSGFFREWFLREAYGRQRALTEAVVLTERESTLRHEARLMTQCLAVSDPKTAAKILADFAKPDEHSRWIAARRLPDEIYSRPENFAAELEAARKLLGEWRATKDKIRFRVPSPKIIDLVVNAELGRPLLRREDRTRPGMFEPAAPHIRRFLQQFPQVVKDRNQFVPADVLIDAPLSELMRATAVRVAAADAKIHQEQTQRELEESRRKLAEAKTGVEYLRGLQRAKQLQVEMARLKKEHEGADKELLAAMKMLNLAVDPEMLKPGLK